MDAQEYPFAILTTAGVDLIDPTPIESALSVYGEYLDEVAALLDHRD